MQQEKFTIKSWAEEDRPREKMMMKGRNALSDAELIAIIIGSGNKNETAVELSKKILASVGNDLNNLAKLNISDLIKFKGIGKAKAINITATLELGRRRKDRSEEKKTKITTSKSAYDAISDVLSDLSHEEFWVIYLNRSNEIIQRANISKGGVVGTVADGKIIFKTAVNLLASSVILCHNHPSGNLTPSQADIQLTKKMKEIGSIVDTPVIDHIIVGNNNYYSFADENML